MFPCIDHGSSFVPVRVQCRFHAGAGRVWAGTMRVGVEAGWQYLVWASVRVTRTLCRAGAGQQLWPRGGCGAEISARAEVYIHCQAVISPSPVTSSTPRWWRFFCTYFFFGSFATCNWKLSWKLQPLTRRFLLFYHFTHVTVSFFLLVRGRPHHIRKQIPLPAPPPSSATLKAYLVIMYNTDILWFKPGAFSQETSVPLPWAPPFLWARWSPWRQSQMSCEVPLSWVYRSAPLWRACGLPVKTKQKLP